MRFGVKLLFKDKNTHTIEGTDIEEARQYIKQLASDMENKKGVFKMLNKKDELIYLCNTDNLIHAVLVSIIDQPDDNVEK